MNLPVAGNEFVCFSKYLCSSFLMWSFVPGEKGKVFLPLEKQGSDVHQTHKTKFQLAHGTEATFAPSSMLLSLSIFPDRHP